MARSRRRTKAVTSAKVVTASQIQDLRNTLASFVSTLDASLEAMEPKIVAVVTEDANGTLQETAVTREPISDYLATTALLTGEVLSLSPRRGCLRPL